MTTQQPPAPIDRTPTWMVQAVFDPDHTGQDFSYTIGLHERGLPELHLWASPPEGMDPGDRWAFSIRDRHSHLNRLALRLVEGDVSVGDSWTEAYDAGEAVVTFTLGSPVDPESVEALGVAPGAIVLPLIWTLQRPPRGRLGPMTSQDRAIAFRQYADLRKAVGRDRQPPDGWALPSCPTFEPEQALGPRTPVVLARAAQLWSADDLRPLLHAVLPHSADGGLGWAASLCVAAIRRTGREKAQDELDRSVPTLVDRVIAADPRRWDLTVRAMDPEHPARDEDARAVIADNLRRMLTKATFNALLLEVAGDHAPAAARLGALGPWQVGFNGGFVVPGDEWIASTQVLRAVRSLLRPVDLTGWQRLTELHNRGRSAADSAYNELCWRLTVHVQTSACGLPWSKLKDLPAAIDLTEDLSPSMRRLVRWSDLEEWASLVGAMLTHRGRFTADDVETLAGPVVEVCPGLARVLNRLR